MDFFFADLHPHMIAMPFGLLVVGLALNWVVTRGQASGVRGEEPLKVNEPHGARPAASLFPCLFVCFTALALGALGAINTWDLPT